MQVKESKTNWHFRIRLIKSAFRIIAGAALALGNLYIVRARLVVAELLGIVEEL